MNKKQKALAMYELQKKNPGAAAGLSLIFVGGGQMYAGEVARGIVMLIACIFMWFFLLGWIWWIIAPIDAYQIAKRQNKLLAMKLDLNPEDVM